MTTNLAPERNATTGCRPPCMVALGICAPYSVDDVKQAYFARARRAHPDAGGNAAEFVKLQTAFDQALDYAKLHGPRWSWLADTVETYTKQQFLIQELRKLGATVAVEEVKWLAHAWGEDFAQVAERIVSVDLRGARAADEAIDLLVRHRAILGTLRRLELAGSNVGDAGLRKLSALVGLTHLGLRDTSISRRGLQVLGLLPELRSVDLRETSIGWATRLKLRWNYPGLKLVGTSAAGRNRKSPLRLGMTLEATA